jgi:thiol-disulfide isomerase/thioredoxin
MMIARNRLAPLTVALLASVALASAGCSSSSNTASQTPQDPGLAGNGDTSAASAPDTNPQGVAYPTANLGTSARAGTRPGNTIINYKFLGYPDGVVANGLQPISLASYFDPTNTKYKLIHIQASGSWCPHCRTETEVVAGLKQKLIDRKVLWLISLAEGPTPGTAATTKDLDQWIAQLKAPFPHVLDPGNKNLGLFYDAAALPWNANISAATMEILSAGVGATETESATLAELDTWLKQIDSGSIK